MVSPIGSWDEDMKFLEQKARDTAQREVIRATLKPQAGEIVKHLTTDYPWLPPGVVAGMAAAGADPSSPQVTAVARMSFDQRTRTGDWQQQGDRIVAKLPAEPVMEQPGALPSPAPEPGTPQSTEALLNPTPQPTPPPEAPGAVPS